MTEQTAFSAGPGPQSPLQLLVQALLRRHPRGVTGMLFYGSCLRSGKLFDGLADLYVIVNDYRSFYGPGMLALANWLLPPNVFYLELPAGGKVLRCKYTVISIRDFERGASRWFESYIWGRFTQPSEIAYSRDAASRLRLQAAVEQCTRSFLNKLLPRLEAQQTVIKLWQNGLRLSYAAELRSEDASRTLDLVQMNPAFYLQSLMRVKDDLRYSITISGPVQDPSYHAQVPIRSRLTARIAWPLRRLQGKTLSVLRVAKALFTFEGGLDYLVWKLERHSGQSILLPDRVRRYPLIFVWGFMFRLYRRGIFR